MNCRRSIRTKLTNDIGTVAVRWFLMPFCLASKAEVGLLGSHVHCGIAIRVIFQMLNFVLRDRAHDFGETVRPDVALGESCRGSAECASAARFRHRANPFRLSLVLSPAQIGSRQIFYRKMKAAKFWSSGHRPSIGVGMAARVPFLGAPLAIC